MPAAPSGSDNEPSPRSRPLPRRRLRRHLARGGLAVLVLLVLVLLPRRPVPPHTLHHAAASSAPFSEYLATRLARAAQEGVRPGNEERLVRRGERAPVVFLVLHGYGASRAECEAVVDPLAERLGATVYYTRLPGHGADMDAHAAPSFADYLAWLEEDFHRVRPLGKKLVLIGSSAGGLLATWLAARHPDDVTALVIASPLFAFPQPVSTVLGRRVSMPLIERFLGKVRSANFGGDPEGREQPGKDAHWLVQQRYAALGTLEDLRHYIATEATFSAVRAPVLLLYYYADATHQDDVLSVPAMLTAYDQLNGGAPHRLSRKVAVRDGAHVLLSAYVRTDKALILTETQSFLQTVLALRNP